MGNNIAYKVVTEGRLSCVTSRNCYFDSGYILQYKKKTIVKAKANTVGILCFDSWANAYRFAKNCKMVSSHSRIIKVQGIGKKRKVKYLAGSVVSSKIDRFYTLKKQKKSLRKIGAPSPPGTICYNAVKVLE